MGVGWKRRKIRVGRNHKRAVKLRAAKSGYERGESGGNGIPGAIAIGSWEKTRKTQVF